ncbi:hypothetical protein C9374_002554 [Naegleria lovaniensis]|uniref:F-box domain-containing protein n=1 Tax=Naegleria lovaniensis TaxID=51637 RepID=A0AA88KKT6_NAELO|nr:uncharacterized protein C9374_002554 [Naegleria lovaniensis]KAG2386108.1 hypothetical protein C9374_002554 [Naegleria lovaniensis]
MPCYTEPPPPCDEVVSAEKSVRLEDTVIRRWLLDMNDAPNHDYFNDAFNSKRNLKYHTSANRSSKRFPYDDLFCVMVEGKTMTLIDLFWGASVQKQLDSIRMVFVSKRKDDNNKNLLKGITTKPINLTFETCNAYLKEMSIDCIKFGIYEQSVFPSHLLSPNERKKLMEEPQQEFKKFCTTKLVDIYESLVTNEGNQDRALVTDVIGISNHERSHDYSYFVTNHVVISVFEFIDTYTLIQTCSNVCSSWHSMILYDNHNVCHYQIFGKRIAHVFLRIERNCFNAMEQELQFENSNALFFFNDEHLDIKLSRIKEIYNHRNWLDIYLLSGMFHLEVTEEYILQKLNHLTHTNDTNTSDLSKKYYYALFKFDILQFFPQLHENHILVRKFSKSRKKVVVVTSEKLPPNYHQSFLSSGNGMITNIVHFENDSPLNSLKIVENMIIRQPLLSPIRATEILPSNTFSIDFKNGIPLYLEFLEDISHSLCSQKNFKHILDFKPLNQVQNIRQCLLNMLMKARHFAYVILANHPLQNYAVGDDVLIGLHLLLLNDFYGYDKLLNLPLINFTQLLATRKIISQNRQHGILNTTETVYFAQTLELFPEWMKLDWLQEMIDGNNGGNFIDMNQELLSPFKNAFNAIDFLQEHIVDMSEACPVTGYQYEKKCFEHWLHTSLEEYTSQLHVLERLSPTKSVDLLLHFHLLHPHHFVQDSFRLAKMVKSHNFNFLNYYKMFIHIPKSNNVTHVMQAHASDKTLQMRVLDHSYETNTSGNNYVMQLVPVVDHLSAWSLTFPFLKKAIHVKNTTTIDLKQAEIGLDYYLKTENQYWRLHEDQIAEHMPAPIEFISPKIVNPATRDKLYLFYDENFGTFSLSDSDECLFSFERIQ